MLKFQAPRGTRDLLPVDQLKWSVVFNKIRTVVENFSFGQIETPIYENQNVFTKPIGAQTDIVEKEMFEVRRMATHPTDSDEEKDRYVLRPEYTAPVVRAYLEHGLASWPQPVKLWYWGPTFRYDRPQKGRFRQFTQFGLEIFGEASPTTDAFLILVLWQIYAQLGIDRLITIDINTIGDSVCRPKIRKTLHDYLQKSRAELCADCRRRLDINPMRVLDCKNEACQKTVRYAPEIVDLTCPACKNHFRQVLEHLDDLNIPYDLNPRLVRGLDYYTKTTFEVRPTDDTNRQSSLGGGGRYDDLVQIFGGQSTPAIGFAGGVDRTVDYLLDQNIQLKVEERPKLCLIQFGQLARRKSLTVVSKLSDIGYSLVVSFDKEGLNAQLKYADKMGAALCLIIGQKEALAEEIIVRNMIDGSQEIVSVSKLTEVLKRKIKEITK